MKKSALALSTIGLVLAAGTPAHAAGDIELYAFGANTGTQGFTTQARTSSTLTDPNNHQISDYCNFSVNGVGNSIVITIVAEAHAVAHATPVSTGIYCEVRDRTGTVVHVAAQALPGDVATVVSPSALLLNNGPYTVCSRGSGQWNDTHLYATPLRCQSPNLPV
ncbi:MAG TPA: hypothetical protein VGX28_11745 [Frankiaceae bacterium]|jgi:hypothetical protein|nr:hypothetical protein [Frankiaceae bacterium]